MTSDTKLSGMFRMFGPGAVDRELEARVLGLLEVIPVVDRDEDRADERADELADQVDRDHGPTASRR